VSAVMKRAPATRGECDRRGVSARWQSRLAPAPPCPIGANARRIGCHPSVQVPFRDGTRRFWRRRSQHRWPTRGNRRGSVSQGAQLAGSKELVPVLGHRLQLAQAGSKAQRAAAVSSRRSTAWTSTSATSLAVIPTHSHCYHTRCQGTVIEQLKSSVRSPIQRARRHR